MSDLDQPKRPGRPAGSGAPAEARRTPRTVRLAEAHAAKLKALGAAWLESKLDAEPWPGKPATKNKVKRA